MAGFHFSALRTRPYTRFTPFYLYSPANINFSSITVLFSIEKGA